MFKSVVLLACISLGGWFGWFLGSPWGLLPAYLIGVFGSSIGLYIGRRLQRNLDDSF